MSPIALVPIFMRRTKTDKSTVKEMVKEYTDTIDFNFTNEIIEKSERLKDFKLSKSVLQNIGEWALNGNSDQEIRKKLELDKEQWGLLVSICPTLILVMSHSRALADTIVAGSLFQVAIGGKRIKKLVPRAIGEYNEDGKKIGEHLETIEVWEELPPNPILLKFLAEHKLSEKFGETKADNSQEYRDFIDNLSPEDRALIDVAKKQIDLHGKN